MRKRFRRICADCGACACDSCISESISFGACRNCGHQTFIVERQLISDEGATATWKAESWQEIAKITREYLEAWNERLIGEWCCEDLVLFRILEAGTRFQHEGINYTKIGGNTIGIQILGVDEKLHAVRFNAVRLCDNATVLPYLPQKVMTEEFQPETLVKRTA